MKGHRVYLAVAVLVLASISCQTFMGGSKEAPTTSPEIVSPPPELASPAPGNSNDNNTNNSVTTDFPMTPDAYNVTEVNGTLVFYTKLSLDDTMKFYRDKYTAMGYKEREILTVVSGGTFSMVFDGDPSGKGVVIQSVDLGDGSRTVTIRLEDV